MDESISDFGQRAKSYDVVLFYYSGHGLQSKGENYLMPIDAELGSEADVKYKCLPLNLLLDKLDESNCPMKIVVLDACRNNPFVKRWYRGGGTMGLASVNNPPQGTYIAFSTAAGSVALDGTGRHSPFTQAFLDVLNIPNLALFDFFNEIGKKVQAETNDEQSPFMSHNTLKGKFFFNQTASLKGSKRMKVVSIMPDWISAKKDDEWVGVSVPLVDREEARKSALVNAILKYLFSEGGVRTGLLGNMKLSNIQTEMRDTISFSESKKSLDLVSLFKYFEIDILKEYFNNNSECFVLCAIRNNTTTENKVMVTRKLQMDEVAKSFNVTLSVEAVISKGYTRIDYSYSKSSFNDGCHHLLIDSVEMAKPAIDYGDCEFTSNSQVYAYPLINISECGSLGLAELALLAQYPTAPKVLHVKNLSDIVVKGKTEVFKNTYVFKANDSVMPIPLTIARIKNKHLCVSIQDPYDAVNIGKQKRGIIDASPLVGSNEDIPYDFCQFINSDEINVEYGQSTDGPLLIGKTLQLFGTAALLSMHEAAEVKGKIISDTIAIEDINQDFDSSFISQSQTEVSNYYPFFFLDGQRSDLRPTPIVKKGFALVRFKNNQGNIWSP